MLRIRNKEDYEMPKMNVESFNLDHTKVVAPFIRLAGTMEGLNRGCHS